MIKTFTKVGREVTYSNIIKAIYDKSTANVLLNSEKVKACPLNKIRRQDAHSLREFPGGLVFRIQCFHFCGLGSIPGVGIEIPHHTLQPPTKKKKRKEKKRNVDWI